jgi:hypothetical protein
VQSPWASRLTWIAVAVLLLDAILLGAVWVATGRTLLLAGAVLALVLALLVVWFRYLAARRWAEVDQARREAKAELEALSEILRSRRP